jgi:hypothetical protein
VTEVSIKVYREVDGDRQLEKTVAVSTSSGKKLTADRAKRMLRSEFPDISDTIILIRSEGGWTYRRTLEAKPECSYHFTWEVFFISENS